MMINVFNLRNLLFVYWDVKVVVGIRNLWYLNETTVDVVVDVCNLRCFNDVLHSDGMLRFLYHDWVVYANWDANAIVEILNLWYLN